MLAKTQPNYYQPIHDDVYKLHDKHFLPASLAALKSGHVERLVCQEQAGVLILPLFNPAFCKALKAEIENLKSWHEDSGNTLPLPNSMHNYGASLETFCMEGLLRGIFTQVIQPIAERYFPHYRGAELDSFYPFFVDYSQHADTDLRLHMDASHITFNLCLSEGFGDSALTFAGERCMAHAQSPVSWMEQYRYEHQIGCAVMHTGMHRHNVEPIAHGRRNNLLLWCRDSSTSFCHDSAAAENQCCHKEGARP